MNVLVDENMPRSLAPQLAEVGVQAADVRDLGLQGQPDTAVFAAAAQRDAIIITRDRGFVYEREWPEGFTAGVVFVNLPMSADADLINKRVIGLLTTRLPASLLGAVTAIERHRALSRAVRSRP